MCSTDIIVYVPKRDVEGVVLHVTCRNRDHSLVTAKNYRHEHHTVCVSILCNGVLRSADSKLDTLVAIRKELLTD